MLKLKECKRCGTEFSWNGWSRRIYCTKKCKELARDHRHKRICKVCGKEFGGRAYQRYCSYECSYRKNQGKQMLRQNGYAYRWDGDQKRCFYEHVEIAERALGRKLKKGEIVHHINGNITDNRNCNLLICTISYHKWLHNEMARRYQREHFA
jgi:hypothetical protein